LNDAEVVDAATLFFCCLGFFVSRLPRLCSFAIAVSCQIKVSNERFSENLPGFPDLAFGRALRSAEPISLMNDYEIIRFYTESQLKAGCQVTHGEL
jgi:hypothetical protein